MTSLLVLTEYLEDPLSTLKLELWISEQQFWWWVYDEFMNASIFIAKQSAG